MGLICSLSFDVQRRRGLARCGPFRIDRKRREDKGSVKIGHFSWMSKMYGPILISKMAAVFFFKFHPKIPKSEIFFEKFFLLSETLSELDVI